MTEPTFDHERLDVYRLSIEYVAFSYRIAKGLAGINRPARDRVVSMLTRLIQRTQRVSEGSVEYEYRDAEYEYDERPMTAAQ